MVSQLEAPRVYVGKAESSPMDQIRILFLGANPSGTTKMALDQEVREITRRLRATPDGSRFEFSQEWAVRLDDLQAALLRHRPHILHFSGHGHSRASHALDDTLTRDAVADPGLDTSYGELIVEDEHGSPVGINAPALTDLLALVGTVRCVVLNACYSAAQCEALKQKADCVIGMARAIPDETAITFSWAFYQALGFSSSIQEAFQLGCNQLKLGKLPGAELPRLVTREGHDPAKIFLTEGARAGDEELDVGDSELSRAIAAIVSNVRDAMTINNEVFRSMVRRRCERLLAKSASWRQGRFMAKWDYNSILVELYSNARDRVFCTSVPDFLANWTGNLGKALLQAHRRSSAKVTRVFVFSSRDQVTESAYRILKEHGDAQIEVRLIFDDEIREFDLRDSKDFTIIDDGEVIGVTMKFTDEIAAEWHFSNEEIAPHYKHQQQQLLLYSIDLDAFEAWWSTRGRVTEG
jgi:hypothetical protein